MEEWVDLTEEQRSVYVAIENREAEPARRSLAQGAQINYPGILATLTKLKQACDRPPLVTREFHPIEGRSEKFYRIIELIEEIVDGEEKVVLSTQWLDVLNLFERGRGARPRRGFASMSLCLWRQGTIVSSASAREAPGWPCAACTL